MNILSKKVSLILACTLVGNQGLFANEIKINNQKEYFNNFYNILNEKEDSKVIVSCDDCGVEYDHPDLEKLLKNYDKNTNIKFVKNGITIELSKELFLTKMQHLYIIENSFNDLASSRIKNTNNKVKIFDNEFLTINGKNISIKELKEQIKKVETLNKLNEIKVEESIENKKLTNDNIQLKVINDNIVKKEELNKIPNINQSYNEYHFALGSFKLVKEAEQFINKKDLKESVLIKESGSYYVVVLTKDNKEKEYKELLEEVRTIKKDAFLLKKVKIDNNLNEKNIIEKVQKKNIESSTNQKELVKEETVKEDVSSLTKTEIKKMYQFVVASSKNKLKTLRFLKNKFSNEDFEVIKDSKSDYYMGVINKNTEKGLKDSLNEVRKVIKDAWYLKSIDRIEKNLNNLNQTN